MVISTISKKLNCIYSIYTVSTLKLQVLIFIIDIYKNLIIDLIINFKGIFSHFKRLFIVYNKYIKENKNVKHKRNGDFLNFFTKIFRLKIIVFQ